MTFVLKLAKLACYFLKFQINPHSRSYLSYYRRVKRFEMNLCLSSAFGSRDGATEILTMMSVPKWQFLATCISETLTNVHAYCLIKLIIKNKWFVYILSLNFVVIILCYIILTSNKANFAVRGPSSFHLYSALVTIEELEFLRTYFTRHT